MRRNIFLLVIGVAFSGLNYAQGQCTTPAEPTNGSHDGGTGDTNDGDTLTFTCNPGYTLDGTAALVCTGTAFVPPDVPTCEPDDCTDPGAAPTNGQKTGNDYSHGSTVTYTCDPGYTLSGPGELTCTAGSWDNSVPTCNADCTDPGAAPANGTKTGDDYKHGATVTYACDEGFTLSGPGTLTCNDGSWDNTVPTCSAGSDTTTETPDPGESGVGGRMPSPLVTLMSILIITLLTY